MHATHERIETRIFADDLFGRATRWLRARPTHTYLASSAGNAARAAARRVGHNVDANAAAILLGPRTKRIVTRFERNEREGAYEE